MKVTQALMQLGHEVRLFAPAEGGPSAPDVLVTQYGLRLPPDLVLVPSKKRLKRLDFVLGAQRAARRFRAGLVYTWLPQSAAAALWSGLPTVLEMHAGVSGRMGAWWLRQFWKAPGRRVMTVTTRALWNTLERSAGMTFPDESVLIAPNGVELEKYDGLPVPAEARRLLGLPEGPTVGFTGHIYPGRGADLLFELARSMPRVRFLWVGGTPGLVDVWRGKLRESGVTNVTMTGFVEHARIPLHQAAADVLLMPYGRSIEASSGQDIAGVINPMKMFEYMASGRAIVSADLPSIREVLNEKNAVLCEAGNWEVVIGDWRLEIERLLGDQARRTALGAQARRDVEGCTWEKREKKILEAVARVG
jgi:glycosyltransferase involved in cell wall biosynthesis